MLSDAHWEDLLDAIENRTVVPVLGPGLLELPPSSEGALPRPFERAVAQALAATHQIEKEGINPKLAEVIAELRRGPLRLEEDLQREMRKAVEVVSRTLIESPPQPLRQLASIAQLPLFVSLTPDAVLHQALIRQGRPVLEVIHARGQSTQTLVDLPTDWQQRSQTPLLYLFGKAEKKLSFAVHEEDRLEYTHDLLTRSGNAPVRSLDELRAKNLLVIGADFSDWLYRFFLRLNNGSRLGDQNRAKREWLSENFESLGSFRSFLVNFSSKSRAIGCERPQQFVAELDRRWRQRHPGAGLSYVPAPHQPRKPIFFVSYSRKADSRHVETLVRALAEIVGDVEQHVWLDRRELGAGDPFWERIREGIRGCAYFLAVVSEGADRITESAFREEWEAANQRRKGIATQLPFIVPVVVDPVLDASRYRHLPPEWPHLDYGHAPGGEPTPELRERLTHLVRELRRAAAGGVQT